IRIYLRLWQLVVRLIYVPRREKSLRAIARPDRIGFVETALRQLLRLHFFVGSFRRRNCPDMLGPFEISVSLVVLAIDGVGDDQHIALAFLICVRRLRWRRR